MALPVKKVPEPCNSLSSYLTIYPTGTRTLGRLLKKTTAQNQFLIEPLHELSLILPHTYPIIPLPSGLSPPPPSLNPTNAPGENPECNSRFEAHELSEVLGRVLLVPPLGLAFLSCPSHLDLLRRRLQHLLLLVRVQTPHTHQRVSVLHQLGLQV